MEPLPPFPKLVEKVSRCPPNSGLLTIARRVKTEMSTARGYVANRHQIDLAAVVAIDTEDIYVFAVVHGRSSAHAVSSEDDGTFALPT